MKNFWNWLVISSANPTKVSLTITGFVGTATSFLIATAPFTHFAYSAAQIGTIGSDVAGIATALLGVVGAIAFAYGLLRKFINTVKADGAPIVK